MAIGFNTYQDSTDMDLENFGQEPDEAYREGFSDGVDDSFNRFINIVENDLNKDKKAAEEGTIVESIALSINIAYKKKLLKQLNKMKNRT